MTTSAQGLSKTDYYVLQSSASLTFNVIHQMMGRLATDDPEWETLRAYGNLALEISTAAYATAQALAAPVPEPF